MVLSAFKNIIGLPKVSGGTDYVELEDFLIAHFQYNILNALNKESIKTKPINSTFDIHILDDQGVSVPNPGGLKSTCKILTTDDPEIESYNFLKASFQFMFQRDSSRYPEYSRLAKDCSVKTLHDTSKLLNDVVKDYTERYQPIKSMKGTFKNKNMNKVRHLFLHQDHHVLMHLAYALNDSVFIVNFIVYYVPYSAKHFNKFFTEYYRTDDIKEFMEGNKAYDMSQLLQLMKDVKKQSPRSSSPAAKSRSPRSAKSPKSKSKSPQSKSPSPIATPAYEDNLVRIFYENAKVKAPSLPILR